MERHVKTLAIPQNNIDQDTKKYTFLEENNLPTISPLIMVVGGMVRVYIYIHNIYSILLNDNDSLS